MLGQIILRWHELLFPVGYTLLNPVQGGVLRGDTLMQVVSGRIDKPTVFISKHLPEISLKRNYSISFDGLMIHAPMLN